MTQLPLGYSTALVGAGYLIGIAAGLSMLVCILIAWAGFVPYYTITSALPDGMTMQKFAGKLYQDRVRLIGAGAMGVAAIWTLITLARPDMDPSQALAAPQAALMTTIAQGIFSSTLAWEYVYIGLGLGVVLVIVDQLLKRNTRSLCLPPLAVGMGIYLPPSVQTPLVVGAVLGYFLRKHMKAKCGEEQAKEGARRGTLFASGLIVGESIIGVLLVGVIVVSVSNGGSKAPLAIVGKGFADTAEWLGFLVFIVFLGIFSKVVLGAGKKQG